MALCDSFIFVCWLSILFLLAPFRFLVAPSHNLVGSFQLFVGSLSSFLRLPFCVLAPYLPFVGSLILLMAPSLLRSCGFIFNFSLVPTPAVPSLILLEPCSCFFMTQNFVIDPSFLSFSLIFSFKLFIFILCWLLLLLKNWLLFNYPVHSVSSFVCWLSFLSVGSLFVSWLSFLLVGSHFC